MYIVDQKDINHRHYKINVKVHSCQEKTLDSP